MGEYKTYINKKRKEVPKKNYYEYIEEAYHACQAAKEYLEHETISEQRAKAISIIKKHEAMAKIKGYEALRSGVDVPFMHRMIREIETIRVALTKNPV